MAPSSHSIYYDEEDCLPLEVFVSELELVVGNKREKADQVQLLELLPKLSASISKTEKASLKQMQRRCESAFKELILSGVSAPISHLIHVCLTKLYTNADIISIYSLVGDLQKVLNPKNPDHNNIKQKACILDTLAYLFKAHGRYLSTAALESMSAARLVLSTKTSSMQSRMAAMHLAAGIVEGLHPMDRAAATAQADAWAIFLKGHKDQSNPEEVRLSCIAVLGGLARGGGAVLWNDGAYIFEEAVKQASSGLLEDGASDQVCQAYANVLAGLAAAVRSDGFAIALRDVRKTAKKASLEKLQGSRAFVSTCIIPTFVQAACLGRRQACTALALAWTSVYLPALKHWHQLQKSLPSQSGQNNYSSSSASAAAAGGGASLGEAGSEMMTLTEEMVEQGVNAAVLLSSAASLALKTATGKSALAQYGSVDPLGSHLSSGELPHLAACALHVLRVGVLEVLNEAGQRQLMERLVELLSVPGTAPAAVVVALEGICLVLTSLGEVSEEEAGILEGSFRPLLSSGSAAVRYHTSQALGALVKASPSSAYRMLGSAISLLDQAAESLVAAGSAGSPSELSAITQVHGSAAALSSLLVATARLPLSCPSSLWQRSLILASKLVQRPASSCSFQSKSAEREAAFIVLGALCQSGLKEGGALEGSSSQLLGLIALALGEDARTELQIGCGVLSSGRPGGDLELSMQLWWRSAALQALPVLLGALGSGAEGRYSLEQQLPQVVELLAPLLTVIDSEPILNDPSRTKGLLSSCVATFNLRLLRCYQLLPGGTTSHSSCLKAGPTSIGAGSRGVAGITTSYLPLPQSQQSCLLRLCMRPLQQSGAIGGVVSQGSAEALYHTLFRHILHKEDSVLGPWSPGRDESEDELRAFVGEEGGPHLLPWEQSLAGLAVHTIMLSQPALFSATAALPNSPRFSSSAAGNRGSALNLQTLSVGGRVPSGTGGSVAGTPRRTLSPSSSRSNLAAQSQSIMSSGEPTRNASVLWDRQRPSSQYLPSTNILTSQAPSTTSPAVFSKPKGFSSSSRSMPASLHIDPAAAHAQLFSQPMGLSASLLNTQLCVIARIMGSTTIQILLQITETLSQCANTLRGQSGGSAAAVVQRRTCCLLAATVALCGVVPLLQPRGGGSSSRGPLDPSDKLSERLLALANAVLDDHATDPAMARAAAMLFAASGVAGSDAWCGRLLEGLISELTLSVKENKDRGRRGVVALSLGCLYRLKGGISLQAALGSTTEVLILAASRPSRSGPPASSWALHALGLVAGAAGPAFLPSVKKVLLLCQQLMVSGVDSPGMNMFCARLANALVAVAGPEFSLGSAQYRMGRSLITGEVDAVGAMLQLEAAAGASSSSDSTAAASAADPLTAALMHVDSAGIEGSESSSALQAVKFIQQLVLFAPQAVHAARHVPLLRAALRSSKQALRRAAAVTLRQLAGLDALAMSREGVEVALFAALDAEPDATSSGQLEFTLEALMAAGSKEEPLKWRDMLSAVVFAAPKTTTTAAGSASLLLPPSSGSGSIAFSQTAVSSSVIRGAVTTGQKLKDEDDDDDGGDIIVGRSGPSILTSPAVRTKDAAAAAAVPVLTAATTMADLCVLLSSSLRLRTRLFAAGLLIRMVSLNGQQQLTRQVADESRGGSVLEPAAVVLGSLDPAEHLQSLVDIGFRMATGTVEALKPPGVVLLQQVVTVFATVEDPLLPGALLLEQYQAQLVSTLRSSLQPGVHPELATAGGSLASTLLGSRVVAGDHQVMRRLMDLLTAPLADWQALSYEQYAEWVAVRARVGLLHAHAQCLLVGLRAEASGEYATSDVVAKVHKPYKSLLRSLWSSTLQDYVILSTQHANTLSAYASELIPPVTSGGSSSSMLPGSAASPALAKAVLEMYHDACPQVMEAWVHCIPSVAVLEEMGVECQRHMRVLEACLYIITEASAELAELVKDYATLSTQEQQRQGKGLAQQSLAFSSVVAESRQPSPRHPSSPSSNARNSTSVDSATSRSNPSVTSAEGTASTASTASARLTSALRSVSGLLSSSVLGSAALWPQIGPICEDVVGAISACIPAALAPLTWSACREASRDAIATAAAARGAASFNSSSSWPSKLLLPPLQAACQVVWLITSGLPPDRLAAQGGGVDVISGTNVPSLMPGAVQVHADLPSAGCDPAAAAAAAAGSYTMGPLFAERLTEVLLALFSLVSPFMLMATPSSLHQSAADLLQPDPQFQRASLAYLPVSAGVFNTSSEGGGKVRLDYCTRPEVSASDNQQPLPLLQQAAVLLLQRVPYSATSTASGASSTQPPPVSLLASVCCPALLGVAVRMMCTAPIDHAAIVTSAGLAPVINAGITKLGAATDNSKTGSMMTLLEASRSFLDSLTLALVERAPEDQDVRESLMSRFMVRRGSVVDRGSPAREDQPFCGESQQTTAIASLGLSGRGVSPFSRLNEVGLLSQEVFTSDQATMFLPDSSGLNKGPAVLPSTCCPWQLPVESVASCVVMITDEVERLLRDWGEEGLGSNMSPILGKEGIGRLSTLVTSALTLCGRLELLLPHSTSAHLEVTAGEHSFLPAPSVLAAVARQHLLSTLKKHLLVTIGDGAGHYGSAEPGTTSTKEAPATALEAQKHAAVLQSIRGAVQETLHLHYQVQQQETSAPDLCGEQSIRGGAGSFTDGGGTDSCTGGATDLCTGGGTDSCTGGAKERLAQAAMTWMGECMLQLSPAVVTLTRMYIRLSAMSMTLPAAGTDSTGEAPDEDRASGIAGKHCQGEQPWEQSSAYEGLGLLSDYCSSPLPAATANGNAARMMMKVLAALIVEAAAPSTSNSTSVPAPAAAEYTMMSLPKAIPEVFWLRDQSLIMLSSLSRGGGVGSRVSVGTASSFKAALSSLPSSYRQRLQGALKAVAEEAGPQGASATSSAMVVPRSGSMRGMNAVASVMPVFSGPKISGIGVSALISTSSPSVAISHSTRKPPPIELKAMFAFPSKK
ncbi:hypothetical protein CEUSTIGMA_g1858.t1 [Chlamydomonas eustigma]|uniref:Uncharacterized protein n=1 Tax=Chlamydomonas eustigma TaxID=1157962 RepID=A0A250WV46_9CHLO|nr:hypothetical protein CEUSTIGMA_g1858.t1 [Chlamydomonas eustigma]|eukprot:GAX74410.1 hypothetical protein CEUSTIGMA_g1858.t1 [Chlamydomonas eustigma]